jgi:hypothetical protein
MNSQDILNLQEAYLSVYEGKVEWDDKNRPLRSGWRPLPKEKMYNKLVWKSRERSNPNRDELKLKKQMNKISDILMNSYTKESYEIIDYLLKEGYAETPESAYVIMENMSEDWKKEVKGALVKTGKYVGKKIAKSTPAKKLKRFVKYTTLGLVGGALLN